MATGYSTNLELALPVQGELSGTWGDTVNNGITQYLDAAIAGSQIISGSQTAVTLSNTNGDAAATNIAQAGSGATGTAQYQIIRCTGNPAGLLTITVSDTGTAGYSKTFIIINATSTSQSVKIVGSGPTTGITVTSGDKALVAWNGTDFVRVGASAGGSNTQVQFNSSGNLAGSANLTFDGTTLVANDITDSSLTATRVVYAGTAGNLTGSSGFVFDGTNLKFASGAGLFPNTSDASDTGTLAIGGGGANSSTRGGVIELNGNENASPGVVDITSGNVASSYVRIQGRSSSSYVSFAINATEQARVTTTGAWSFGSSGTATGTAGQVLTSQGSGAAPTWTTASGGSTSIGLVRAIAINCILC